MTVENIIRTFCECRSVEEPELVNKKSTHVHETKYLIWLYLHCEMGMSATQLAKRFNRNRPSIFRGIRIIKHCIKYSDNMARQYHDIVEKLEGAANATPSEDMD